MYPIPIIKPPHAMLAVQIPPTPRLDLQKYKKGLSSALNLVVVVLLSLNSLPLSPAIQGIQANAITILSSLHTNRLTARLRVL